MRAVITDYGAKGDGQSMNTEAIQAAVNACAEHGGGIVFVPSGVFVTGSVELKSKVTLYLGQGAVLKASPRIEDYRVLPVPSDEFKRINPWLYALEQTDVRIVGEGEMDLNDDAFVDWTKYLAPAEHIAQLDERQLAETIVTPLDRPSQMVFFHKCERVGMAGVTLRKSSCYNVSVSLCRNVRFEGVTIDCHLQVPNNDGLNFYSSQDVVIHGCRISSGDDCIAITGISNWDTVCERFTISDCSFTSRSSAVRIGHQASKVRDIVISNVVVSDTNRGFGIFAGDDGWVRDVLISNAVLHTRLIAGGWWGKGEPALISTADSSGEISGISMSHIRAYSENSVILAGRDGSVSDISLNDWRIELSHGPNRALFGGLIDLSPATPRPAPADALPWLNAGQAREITLSNIRVTAAPDLRLPIDALLQDIDDVRESNVRVVGV